MLDFSKNHFDLFGLPIGYIVDGNSLSERYRDLQRLVHPDRYAHATDQERRLSVQGASLINEAFETLKDPIARASYLLTLHGIKMDAQNESTQDMRFLMQQMELREELEEIPSQNDSYQAIIDLRSRINKQITSLVAQMAVQFETPTEEQLRAAREILRKMRFLQKLHVEAESVEAALEDELN
ncbi:MAG: Fe-S protein assembly co-chaperone HscB [Candidatus Thiodiazotropha sp. (ex Lucinoma aequizonata)]|nr:Fe-S protein assembly co-chaperone HscB [Candidatus Thiodiazotropha sp. (ex Lucinoma aequizonata)]MCU7889524.1 Fe-S protein assembly co-chaperone HscB [Candidatus Thiodiazotropha sp. (ex Lucinoma aequizonata)]MCU7895746.1 Fe-S protein assembly co-chaperone HscB [Candidatus Thiodiazotropha sp. (ex Lucinoma aequizonata)]MCU7898281.1 Fe-S protein assembly co-chaperone HscB [Candidatus Thiodiazotropha sp. (ex Lucinoma aequizonata)]MCU7903647.1 Fe-S protein assembly co-chaperone HscB [Candidatus 